MKLMYDNSDVSFEQELTEGLEKKYRIKGIFSTPEKQNKNGRIYPMNIWEREVEKYQEVLKSGHPNCLMELNHPSRSQVDMMEAVARIEKVYIENGYVMGEAVLLDNPKANQLKTLIDNGIKMAVSSRGVGSVKGNLVENYKLICWDLIPNLEQSDHSAEMYGIVEGVLQDKNFLITESGEIKEVLVVEKEDNLDEPIQESKKELTLEEKKVAGEKLMQKFSEILGKSISSINESKKYIFKRKINGSEYSISVDYDLKSNWENAIKNMSDEDFYKCSTGKNLNEAKMIQSKFKKGQVVKFNDKNGKKTEGSIANLEYDQMENGNWCYFYDIETKEKLLKDIPEGDIF